MTAMQRSLMSAGSNVSELNALHGSRILFPWTPDLRWADVLDFRDFSGPYATTSTALTVAAADVVEEVDYTADFTGGPLGTTVYTATYTSEIGDDETDIAAGLAAAIVLVNEIAAYLDEVVATDEELAISFVQGGGLSVTYAVDGDPLAESTVATTHALALTTLLASTNPFPDKVDRRAARLNVTAEFSTGSTLDLGDAAAATGLMAAVSVATTGWKQDLTAAEVIPRYESAYAPAMVLHTVDSILPAEGAFYFEVQFAPEVKVL